MFVTQLHKNGWMDLHEIWYTDSLLDAFTYIHKHLPMYDIFFTRNNIGFFRPNVNLDDVAGNS